MPEIPNQLVTDPNPAADLAKTAADLQAAADAEFAKVQEESSSPEAAEAADKAAAKADDVDVLAEALADKKGKKSEEKVNETPAGEEYVPNLKFKVLNEEKEFDDWIKPAINKETEGKIRELYEKAHGVDHFRTEMAKARQEREQIENQFGQTQETIKNIVGWRDKNLGIFFEKVGLTKQQVAKWMVTELQKEELPEHQREVYTQLEAQQRRLEELEQANSRLAYQSETGSVQARESELNQALSDPNIAPLVQAFDARLAKPGAFADMVVRHGRAEWEASGNKVDLTPKEAVSQVLKILNLQTQAPSQVTKPNESSSQASPAVIKQAKPVVLPNVGSGSSSPAAKRVKSIDDIRAAYKQISQSR